MHLALILLLGPLFLSGTVSKVYDGDTITLSTAQGPAKIRLYGIDCPELRQEGGQEARSGLLALLGQSAPVSVVSLARDRYKRHVGLVVTPGGQVVNHRLVGEGLCWHYRDYSRDDQGLLRMEGWARRHRLGVFAKPGAVPPWEWRRARRKK